MARVLGLADHTGSMTPGKHADLTLIDMRSAHLDSFGDPVAAMVLGAGPTDVDTVIVGGEVLKRGGHLTGDHVAVAREAMHRTRAALRAHAR